MSKIKTDSSTKLDLKDLSQRHEILRDGLQNFLDDNRLNLSDQNFERAFQHLLSSTIFYKDMALYDVTNYLQQILEYHEHVIDTMNKTGLAEESLIKLIVTADNKPVKEINNKNSTKEKRWKFSLSTIPLPVATSLLLVVGFAIATPFVPSSLYPTSFQNSDSYNEIGISSVNELKGMVKELAALEKNRGHDISPATIWNEVKALDTVTSHGYKSSYKNFNPAQYKATKVFLENRIHLIKTTDD